MIRPNVMTFAAEVAGLGLRVIKARGSSSSDDGPPNTYGLPEGDDIRKELVRWFRRQLRDLLGTVREIGVDLPDFFPDLADYTDPMATAMTPLLSAYWDKAGKEVRARIGLDPNAWRITDPRLRQAIRTAAFRFCDSTNKTTGLQLRDAHDALRVQLEEGIVDRGEALPQLTKRVKGVFAHAETWRARRIAATEASRATHAAEYESAKRSGVVVGVEWLVSEDACQECQQIAREVGRARLGRPFARIGNNPAYRDVYHPPLHPNCQCSLVEILDTKYGGPDDPEWGDTLVQPDGEAEPGPQPKPESESQRRPGPEPKPEPRPEPVPRPEARRPRTEFESDLEMIADARDRQRIRNAESARERTTVTVTLEVSAEDREAEVAELRRKILEQEARIVQIRRDIEAHRADWDEIRARWERACDRADDFSATPEERRRWEDALAAMKPEYERLQDLVESAEVRIDSIRKHKIAPYVADIERASGATKAQSYDYAGLHERHPDLIPPGLIGDRIAAYTLGDAKLEAIARAGTREERELTELAGERWRKNREIDELSRQQADLVDGFVGANRPIPPHVDEQVRRLQREIDAIVASKQDLRDRERVIREDRNRQVAAILRVERPAEIELVDVPEGTRDRDDNDVHAPSDPTRRSISTALDWMRQVTAAGDTKIVATRVGERPGVRAYYQLRDDFILLAEGQDPAVVAHEVAHVIERRMKVGPDSVLQRCQEFLRHRVGDEVPTSLKDKFGAQYADWEVGRKDEFDRVFDGSRAYYVGKDYGPDATEVLSMGVEELFRNPIAFAKKDPEYARFVMGILDGSLR